MSWIQLIRDVVITAIPIIFAPILSNWIKTTNDKNNAIRYFQIAQDILAMIILKNPDLNQAQIIDQAMAEIKQVIDGIDPTVAARVVNSAYVTLKSSGAVK